MLKKLSLLLLVLICLPGYGQDITATIKTASAVAPGKDLTVEISVSKAGVSGFMKYFQDLPANYTATDIDSKGGNFTNADNGAKIIWISPPSSDQFTMTYKIAVPQGASGTISVGGKFSYVVGNERKTFDVEPQVVSIGSGSGSSTPPVVKEVVKETPPPAETKPPAEEKPAVVESKPTPPPAEEKPKPVETKKETPVVITPPVNKTPVSAAPTATAGRSYRVQIGAFALKPHIEGVPESSTIVLDNGMTKYFSGNFKTYEEAKKRKNEMIEKGFQGAFIVSFENGKIVK
ncbi:MAG: hypothetical protein JWO44_617 [Bacteroidetes bacterium]|nr:hypothetical protein [Bacteroidota bacterium]